MKMRLKLALCAAPTVIGFAGVAQGQPFTYTFFPNDAAISTPVTTDYAIVGYSGGQYNPVTFAPEFTGPSSPTVTIADGADIPEADLFNSSVVNMTGGAAALFPFDHSTVNIHGGTVPFALTWDSSVFNMYAGEAGDLEGQGHQINVYGGNVGTLVANANSDYYGNTLGSCEVNVFGGIFSAGNDLTAFNEGILNIHGGLIQSAFIRAAEGGTLNIFGTNLAAALINPNDANGYSIYTLSGQLEDGHSIDGLQLRVRNDGVTYGHSTFNLVNVPAPGAAGVLAIAGVLASRRRRGGKAGSVGGFSHPAAAPRHMDHQTGRRIMMTNRSFIVRVAAAGLGLSGAARVEASPIQYVFSTTASGSIGSQSFTGQPTEITFSADTGNIYFNASPPYWSVPGSATISIAGVGTSGISTSLEVFNNGSGLGISRAAGPTDLLDLFLPGLTNYHLNTVFGPATSTAQGSNWTEAPITSALGVVVLDSQTPYTFRAVVPSPGTGAALAAAGLLAAQRRRRS